MNDNEQLRREFTNEERRRLVYCFSLLIEIDQQEKIRYVKLKDSPKGFAKDASMDFVSSRYTVILRKDYPELTFNHDIVV